MPASVNASELIADQRQPQRQPRGRPRPGGPGTRLREALQGTSVALAELREMDVPEQIFVTAAQATVERCGFDRAIAFAVVGEELVAQSVFFADDEEWAARTLLVGRSTAGRPRLSKFIVETDLLRRRTAARVMHAQEDPLTPRALVEETRTTSYVAAPIQCDGKVIGFLHADQHFKAVEVDEIDCDVLSAFAIGVGLVLERQLLRRHVLRQRTQLTAFAREVGMMADASAQVDLELTVRSHTAGDGSVTDLFWDPTVKDTLSVREREVIQLLVGGATNAMIARRLYISESTAKAHVHHILKKLGAANRAEAVAKFLRGAT
jgi:DNA-binding CsgD family transcriptional regulator